MSGDDQLPVEESIKELAGEDGATVRAVVITVPNSRPRLTAEQQLGMKASMAEDFAEVAALLKEGEPVSVLVKVKDVSGSACDWVYAVYIPADTPERMKQKWMTAGEGVRLTMLPAKVRVLRVVSKGEITVDAITEKAKAKLEHISSTPLGEVPEGNLIDFVMKKWESYGDKIATQDGLDGQQITYKELAGKIRSCAAGLQARGLQKGEVVAIFAPNSSGWLIAFQAIVLAGGTATTINPAYGAAEVEHQLKHAKAVYMVTMAGFLAAVKTAVANAPQREIFCLDEAGEDDLKPTPFAKLLEEDASKLVKHEINFSEDLVVIPYSSGTTGVPKGVMLTHKNIVTNLVQVSSSKIISVSTDDAVVAVLPFFHIYGMVVILMNATMNGAKMVIMPKFEPAPFLNILKGGITLAYVAPPIVAFLAKHPSVEAFLPFPALKDLFSAAAPLGYDLASICQKRLGIKSLRQGYGMTELSPVGHLVGFGSPKYNSIGQLIPGITCKLVDPEAGETLDLASQKPGEIWLKGANVMKGYLDNVKATAETIDEEGFLHTGDIAYMDADGDFFIVDRLKELIKAKGFQVAPAELEDLLMQNPDVADAAVIGVAAAREGDGEVPKAFVVKKPDSTIDEEGIKKFIAERVVDYKRLGHVEFIESVPKSAAGKILRKELRAKEKGEFNK